KLRVKSLPSDMPQSVDVSISKLEVGSIIRVRDVKTEKYAVINTPDDTITSVSLSRALKQAETEASKTVKK
ncbi:MAG: 50S ribosomal protein L25, partial [Pedobacter sp.]|nr:50S ribosomal protein L25 [Pedobacter sp.]